jgi:hypothetical protein
VPAVVGVNGVVRPTWIEQIDRVNRLDLGPLAEGLAGCP